MGKWKKFVYLRYRFSLTAIQHRSILKGHECHMNKMWSCMDRSLWLWYIGREGNFYYYEAGSSSDLSEGNSSNVGLSE